jgi:D-serine deaminase-like pyridoxal phosphate-dependent protein
VMGYEGQIAGLGDAPPGHPVRGQLIRVMQARSAAELGRRRAEAVRMIEALTGLEFVNGGGTGSLESTAADSSVTELTAGSGLVGPTLFDAYRRFAPEPALLYALPVVRRPGPGIATLFSGGYVASGPGTRDRLPRPYLPPGLSLIGVEGAGEVQTPVRGPAADRLRPGDRVWLRHAKADELAERFTEYHVIVGDQATAVPTYRGEGQCFG